MDEKKARYGLNSHRIYTVFRLIVNGKANTNSEISDYLDLSQGTIGDSLNSLENHGVIEKGEQGRSQPYEIDVEGLLSVFCEVWDIEEDVPSDGFKSFLQRYVELYDKGDSSIRKMLREDFAEAAISYERMHGGLPEKLEFVNDIPGLEAYVPVQDYFERAVEDIFEAD